MLTHARSKQAWVSHESNLFVCRASIVERLISMHGGSAGCNDASVTSDGSVTSPEAAAEPATPGNASIDTFEADGPAHHAVQCPAHDLAGFGRNRVATIDVQETAFAQIFAALPFASTAYRRCSTATAATTLAAAPGQPRREVLIIRFALASVALIALDHTVPPARVRQGN